ncbi:hypothetical protein FHW16_004991 [Phyllobacterium myrsinacearum]|uniref:Uncharacterized protein n=1 Tax=Phyllobacterium myrsinacearum TaxID=28101 RepID=A0A839EL82_9HYPH|nr:hypothetical protein [Phyllobacterium myrsinacearum]
MGRSTNLLFSPTLPKVTFELDAVRTVRIAYDGDRISVLEICHDVLTIEPGGV